MTFSVAPHLDGLANLARRQGVDIRPILVRVLTDLYVQKSEHSAEEEQHYVEIMLRFVDTADLATRANVSRKLALYAAAPRAVLNRLARDRIEVAEPVLQNPTSLNAADLLAIAAECGGRHAALIAQTQTHLRGAPDLVSAVPAPPPAAKAEHETAPVERLGLAKPVAAAPVQPLFSAADVARQFLAAESGERRRLLAELGAVAHAFGGSASVDAEAMHRLERFALQRRRDDFTTALEQTLSLSPELAARVVQDESGELLVVCLRSLAMPPNILLRILLFLNPVIGQSVDHVYDLGRLYETIPQGLAVQLVQGLRIVWQTDMAGAAEQRRALSDISHDRHSAAESARTTSQGDGAHGPAKRPERAPATDRRYGTT